MGGLRNTRETKGRRQGNKKEYYNVGYTTKESRKRRYKRRQGDNRKNLFITDIR